MKRIAVCLTILILIVGGVVAQTPIETSIFTLYRSNFARTGLYDSPPILTQPDILWSFDLPRPNRSSIAIANGLAYTGTEAGILFALDVNTGAEVWRFEAGGSIVSTAQVDHDTLYVASLNSRVYRLNALTGELIWEFATGGEVYASPLLYGDRIFIGSRDGMLYAIDVTSGTEQWRADMGGEIWSSAALFLPTSTLIVGARSGRVSAFTYDGVVNWTTELGGAVDAAPAIDGPSVYVGNYDGTLHTLNAVSGEIIWQVDLPSAIYASTAVGSQYIYVNDYDGNLVALDKATGEESWRYDIGSPAYSSPSVSRDPITGYEMVYALSEEGGLMYGIDALTGEELWRVQTGEQGDWRSSSPVIVDGVLFIGSNTEGVIAYYSGTD